MSVFRNLIILPVFLLLIFAQRSSADEELLASWDWAYFTEDSWAANEIHSSLNSARLVLGSGIASNDPIFSMIRLLSGWSTSSDSDVAQEEGAYLDFVISCDLGYHFKVSRVVVNLDLSGSGRVDLDFRLGSEGFVHDPTATPLFLTDGSSLRYQLSGSFPEKASEIYRMIGFGATSPSPGISADPVIELWNSNPPDFENDIEIWGELVAVEAPPSPQVAPVMVARWPAVDRDYTDWRQGSEVRTVGSRVGFVDGDAGANFFILNQDGTLELTHSISSSRIIDLVLLDESTAVVLKGPEAGPRELEVVRLDAASTPVSLKTWDAEGAIGIELKGSKLYAVGSSLIVFGMEDPLNPVEQFRESFGPLAGQPWGLIMSDDVLILEYSGALESYASYSLEDPVNPVSNSEVLYNWPYFRIPSLSKLEYYSRPPRTSSPYYSVKWGPYLVTLGSGHFESPCADSFGGGMLSLIDIETTQVPRLISQNAFACKPYSLAVNTETGFLLLADGYSGLKVFDVVDHSPQWVGTKIENGKLVALWQGLPGVMYSPQYSHELSDAWRERNPMFDDNLIIGSDLPVPVEIQLEAWEARSAGFMRMEWPWSVVEQGP